MKIKSVEARWVHIPIPPERQHVSDFGRTLSFDGTLVRIETECGLVGWGEAKAQVGGMAQNQALTCMINDEFAPLLKGEDPRDITRLWETLYSGTRGHYALARGHEDAAIALLRRWAGRFDDRRYGRTAHRQPHDRRQQERM